MRNKRQIIENNNTVIEKTNDYIADRTVKIIESEKQPIEKQVLIQKEIINTDTITINELKDSLQKTNEELKNVFYIDFGISCILTAGFNDMLDLNFTIGLVYKKYFLYGRLYIGVGASVEMSKNVINNDNIRVNGANIILEVGINFKNKKYK